MNSRAGSLTGQQPRPSLRAMFTRSFSLLPVLLFAAFPLAAKAAEPIQSYNTYKSWLVACDNTLRCEAKGFPQDGNAAELDITRDAGPDGAMRAVIASESAFTASAPRLGGTALPLSSAWQRKQSEDGTAFVSTDAAAIRALVQQIRNAPAITLPGDTSIPLDGFTAAIRRMDARQGRTGGVTALLDTGPAPADKALRALPLPLIPAHPVTVSLGKGEAAKLIASTRAAGKAVLAKEGCDTDVGDMAPEADALSAHQALVLIPCIMGAYQGSSIGFLTDRGTGKAAELSLSTPYQGNSPGNAQVTGLTEAAFDSKTGMLSMAARGRGIADCGIAASWIWDGSAFQLSALSFQDTCGGTAPGDWPDLFRSRQ